MRLCKTARFWAFLRVFALFLCCSVRFFPAKTTCTKKKARNPAKMCKKRFHAIPPVVIPPFACHRNMQGRGKKGDVRKLICCLTRLGLESQQTYAPRARLSLLCDNVHLLTRNPRFGVTRKGSPQFVPIVPNSPFSSDVFALRSLVFCWNVPICSDLLRFLPISFQNKSEHIKKEPSADPFCNSPTHSEPL